MKTYLLVLFLVIALIGVSSADQFYGVNYNPKRADGSCSSYERVVADLRIIKTYTTKVKTFSLRDCRQAELILRAVRQIGGMKVSLGIWPTPESTFRAEKQELMRLNRTIGLNNVIAVSVGSEHLYRGDLTPRNLATKIYDVKGMLRGILRHPEIKITTADVYYELVEPVITAVDFLTMNAFSYWEGVPISSASNTLFSHIYEVRARSKGKMVVVGETGWPTAGSNFGAAVPSSANLRTYLNQVVCRARRENVRVFWFSAFDSLWKPAGVERNWGLYNYQRQRKSAFSITMC